jgi:hypothetical protein
MSSVVSQPASVEPVAFQALGVATARVLRTLQTKVQSGCDG